MTTRSSKDQGNGTSIVTHFHRDVEAKAKNHLICYLCNNRTLQASSTLLMCLSWLKGWGKRSAALIHLLFVSPPALQCQGDSREAVFLHFGFANLMKPHQSISTNAEGCGFG
ncbi:hypothetical protein EVA_15623 [gut metagenome]|uniref:Uncharacterized protein n=1 Tax=gut metagenome TaxID=749906 RepID=J9G9Z3_9ZZZZ